MKTLLFISIPSVVHPEYLTSDEAAVLLNVSIRTVRTWARKGKLKPYQYAHRVFYKLHELIQVIAQ